MGVGRTSCPPCPISPQTSERGAAFEQLIREAAQGDVVYNDDTSMRIMELMGKRAQNQLSTDGSTQRSGIFTSGIVTTCESRRIALLFTGNQHAGENLQDVLAGRADERSPPIQMCDALSRNMPKELKVIVANCMAHGRRKFVELADIFPEPCLHVLEVLKKVYRVDAQAK